MAIKVQIIQDRRKTGSKLFYVRAAHKETVDTKQIAQHVQDSCTAKTSDVLAIIEEFHFVLNMLLRESMQVQIDGLGTFRLNIHTTGGISEELFDINHCLRSIGVAFRPQLEKRPGWSYSIKWTKAQGMYRLSAPICDGVKFELDDADVKAKEVWRTASPKKDDNTWNEYMGRVTKKKTQTS